MKASELAAWAVSAHENGWVYWYGTCGYACTESLLTRKARQYPAHYSSGRMARYRRDIAEGRVLEGNVRSRGNGCASAMWGLYR